jgi:ubiquitin carboxyl-terminal hydrolase 10
VTESVSSTAVVDGKREDKAATDQATLPPQQPKQPPSSWAALLQPKASRPQPTGQVKSQPLTNPANSSAAANPAEVISSMKFTGISTIVSNYQPTFDWTLLEPRGLINNVNTCFVNVVSVQSRSLTSFATQY